MPLVYLGTGWLIGIALASALRLPLEFLLLAFLVPIGGLLLWKNDRRSRLIRISFIFAICGALWFIIRLPRIDQNSRSTSNRIGVVTIKGQLTAPPEFATFNYPDYLTWQKVCSMFDRPPIALERPCLFRWLYRQTLSGHVRFKHDGWLPRIIQCS
jgi:hypothetical protein